jgi:hypothetical protein
MNQSLVRLGPPTLRVRHQWFRVRQSSGLQCLAAFSLLGRLGGLKEQLVFVGL